MSTTVLYSVLPFDIGSLQQVYNSAQRWKFNTHLLNVFLIFKLRFQLFYSCNNEPEISPSILWETWDEMFSIKEIMKQKSKEEQQKLEIQLSECEGAYNQY